MFAEQRIPDFLIFRETVSFEFGEYLVAVREYLESSVAEGLQLEQGDLLFKFFQNLLRQTDGCGFILSGSAVFNFD